MTWWRRLWRQSALERDLDNELRFHVEQHAADLVTRGLEPGEAMRKKPLSVDLNRAISFGAGSPRFASWAHQSLPHSPAETSGGREILEHFLEALLRQSL